MQYMQGILHFMKVRPPALAPIFRSDAQGRVLATLFERPDDSWSIASLSVQTGVPAHTVLREVGLAERAGLVSTTKRGNTRLTRANNRHPLARPLHQILSATWGVPAVLLEEFEGIDGLEALTVFGSWAARWQGIEGRTPRDIDVLAIGSADRGALYDAATRAEARIGLPVQVVIRPSVADGSPSDPLLVEIAENPTYEIFRSVVAGGVDR